MKTLLVILLSINLFASVKQDILNLYQNKKFESACNIGFNNFRHYNKDEEFLSLYAFSCLKADYIDRLALPIAKLKFSPESRSNSAYFSIILMQKKLLYHALVDDYDLSELNLPSTDYILSKVFEFYTELGKHDRRTLYIFDDPDNNKVSYKLYLQKDYKTSKMVIEEYYDTMLIKRHIYW
ncbi:hypothetical protein [Sulfurimonas microaerophilic]|uniref:hypothetical protein n=1 Tax=Sulfurimonas microaerophilic TaxID=3058392 RepID=UPI0027153420|nr:hypothetical protein [Sulfurimonas sp. hsl 1-7]